MSPSGFSPLDPGQWPLFLGVYGVFFAFQNVIRPVLNKTKNIIVGSGPFPWECTGSSLPFKASFARCDTVFDDVTLCMMM